MAHQLETYGVAVVLIGGFNPHIFHPAWLASLGLIGKQEAEEAKIEIVLDNVSVFKTEWFRMEVTDNRFLASTLLEPCLDPLKDLVIGIFKNLPHTPVKMMGINTDMHFRMPSEKEWHAIGDALAPKQIWKKLFNSPGLLKLTIQSPRENGFPGNVNVRVEPSTLIKPGVFINVNDHYECEGRPDGATAIVNMLEKSYRDSLKRAKEIAETLLTSYDN